ncbi:MAG: hypothetical protein KatS3mg104_1082 [Phycisphaerae bacterium]|nr:MAG: hypothetical protein KatS3mg104_1082 [Phycisphaerae bacterium]
MRIVNYNILDGGVGRADPLGEVIQAQKADVVVLVEADEDEVIDRLAKRFKMDRIVAPGHGHRLAILSRWAIRETINHSLIHPDAPRSCCEAVICLQNGTELPVIGLHLHPGARESDEKTRQQEMACVMRITHDYRSQNRPHLLVGDLNSNSPVQQIDPSRCQSSTRQAWQDNGGDLPRRVVQNLLEHGYIDTLECVRPDQARTLATFTTHKPGQRVDFIFSYAIDPSKIVDAWVEQDRLATYASDHYPVGAEIHV